jgi:hypothetical protein
LDDIVGALDGVGLDVPLALFRLGHLGGVGLEQTLARRVGIEGKKVRGEVASAAVPTEQEAGEGA